MHCASARLAASAAAVLHFVIVKLVLISELIVITLNVVCNEVKFITEAAAS